MKTYLTLIAAILMMTSCKDDKHNIGEFENIPESNSKEEITQALRKQQDAWNQGQIREFMKYYLNSEDLTFTGSKGVTKGHEQVLNRYLKRYDTPEKMGTLKFNILEFEQLSITSAYVIGEWALERSADNPSGYFTLVWKKVNGEWKIIHDHTS